MKKICTLLIVTSILLSACGSRDEAADTAGFGENTFDASGNLIDGNPDLGAAIGPMLNVSVLSDASAIETGDTNTTGARITAVITDDNRNAVSGQLVSFAATGGALQSIVDTTDENGEASAVLTPKGDYTNQDITVTVSAGDVSGSVVVTSSGSSLELTGPDSVQLNDQVPIVIALTAGDGNPISNQVVTLSSRFGNDISQASGATDENGQFVASISSVSGSDTITAVALGGSVTQIYNFFVSADTLTFENVAVGQEINVDTPQDITVSWISQGQPVVGEALRFSTTAGRLVSPSEVTTDANGEATITLLSSSAGPATVSAEAASDGDPAKSIDIEFVATTPASLALDTSSSRVQTLGESLLLAVVTDINGNPVKNQEVAFTSGDLKGGQINPASAITNSAGEASVVFTAGDSATQLDEISVVAEVLNQNINAATTLTVVERVLNVTIGSSNKLVLTAFDTQYRVAFVVQVADGSGTPISDADVVLSIEPQSYRKGSLDLFNANGETILTNTATTFAPTRWGRALNTVLCQSEDINGNRILDPGEDINGNGTLDPQDPASLAPSIAGSDSPDPLHTIEGGLLTTDTTGSGFFDLLYPVSNSLWSTVKITARAQALGAEAEDAFTTLLKIDADTITVVDADPPNLLSPYGTDVFSANPCATTF